MDVRIKTTGYEIAPATAGYLNERLAALERLLGDEAKSARCEVELGRDAGRPRHGEHVWFAEITIRTPGGASARATNRAESINAAIDDVREEIERQLRRERKLHIRLLRRGGSLGKRLLRMD